MRMLNPLPFPNLRGRQFYKLEPYVVVAGVYAAAAHLAAAVGHGISDPTVDGVLVAAVGAALVDDQLGMPFEIPPPRSLLIKKDY